jgi:hypothetical protein
MKLQMTDEIKDENDTNDDDHDEEEEEQAEIQVTMEFRATISQVETVQAIGVGGTKREARHVALAKLLALLFPECQGMVEVKQAAEAVREKYAASRALKQPSKPTHQQQQQYQE